MSETPRRILLTGLASTLGGQLAALLEREPDVEAIVGIDTDDPRHELERTEFVRVGIEDRLLRRIIRAADIDTVIDTRLISDSLLASPARSRQVNIEGTTNLLAACSGPESPVRRLVFRSSADVYGFSNRLPLFLTESTPPVSGRRSAVERDVLRAEELVQSFAAQDPRVTVTVLRAAPVITPGAEGSYMALLELPVIPAILGFDPRFQFVHRDDLQAALAHAALRDLPGTFNLAADGVLVLSEIASLLGRPLVPVLPPWGTALAAGQLRRLGIPLPVELLAQLRHGRGLDNRRLKATGFAFRHTTREVVLGLAAHRRMAPMLARGGDGYRYEREVEEFLRWSPSVRNARQTSSAPAQGGDVDHRAEAVTPPLDALPLDELLTVLGSLDPADLHTLRAHERARGARPALLEALDRVIGAPSGPGDPS